MRAAVPSSLLSSFGSYPNVLGLTDEHRQLFHPVLSFPEAPVVVDYTTPSQGAHAAANQLSSTARMATQEEWHEKKERCDGRANDSSAPTPSSSSSSSSSLQPLSSSSQSPIWTLGRYDEDRVGLYESPMFDDVDNVVNGFAGKRTVHVGIDLGGPVHTPVFSFWNGVIRSVGYNPDLGDYGHVVVVHYPQLPSGCHVYALYGHLDKSVRRWKVGDQVATGQVLGGLGDVHENGGWLVPHVHFQLGLTEPETHDMAGAVSVRDRGRALLEHPDPRYVLGPLY
jgi:peptidoglycan LD-endopeptidase LytH